MRWHDLFRYENGKIFWKVRKSNNVKVGSEAGNISDSGRYRSVMIDEKTHKVHRVIWEMHNGDIPKGMQIDHLNHETLDNRIENLRLVTIKENTKNRSFNKNNNSGHIGVSWYKRYGKWNATIGISGKQKNLGYFSSMGDAIKARKNAESELCYHNNHGEKK